MKSKKIFLIAILVIPSVIGITAFQDSIFNENQFVGITEFSSDVKSSTVDIVDLSSDTKKITVGITDGVGLGESDQN